jgi:hypothetical protein
MQVNARQNNERRIKYGHKHDIESSMDTNMTLTLSKHHLLRGFQYAYYGNNNHYNSAGCKHFN